VHLAVLVQVARRTSTIENGPYTYVDQEDLSIAEVEPKLLELELLQLFGWISLWVRTAWLIVLCIAAVLTYVWLGLWMVDSTCIRLRAIYENMQCVMVHSDRVLKSCGTHITCYRISSNFPQANVIICKFSKVVQLRVVTHEYGLHSTHQSWPYQCLAATSEFVFL